MRNQRRRVGASFALCKTRIVLATLRSRRELSLTTDQLVCDERRNVVLGLSTYRRCLFAKQRA